MKSVKTSVRLSSVKRILAHSTLLALVLLCVGFWAASVSAKPVSPAPLQYLPTRPPPSKPEPKPPSEPSGPSEPSEPNLAPPTPTPVPSPTPVPTPSVDLTLEELGYRTFQLSGSRWIDFYVARNVALNRGGSYLDLIISHLPAEPDREAFVRVSLNGVQVGVIALSPQNAEPTTSRLYLSNGPIIPGRNRVGISLDGGAACNVGGARVDVTVYGGSSFHLEYSLTRQPADLALYPSPFFERSFEYEPVYVVLPENPSVADMSAAATIAAGLGLFSQGEIRLASVLDTEITASVLNDHHLIVLGKRGANRLLDQLNLPLSLDDPQLSRNDGVIQELVSPWNPLRMILVVTGGSDQGLTKASQALSRKEPLSSMQGPVAVVQTVPEASSQGLAEGAQRDVDVAVAALGYEEAVVYGTAPHVLDYGFRVPLGAILGEDARFILHFAHAPIASPTHSVLDVYFNDVPVRSVLLDESNANEGRLDVSLPPWLVRSGRNDIRISIEMNLDGEDKCLFLDEQRLWTAIYSDSYFHLPLDPQGMEPSLNLFPYPFNARPNRSGLLLVLADRPERLDYDLMLRVAARLGSGAESPIMNLSSGQGEGIALDVITADLVTQEHRQNKDLILIGRPSIHTLIAELNDALFQSFEPGSDQLRSQVESAAFVRDPSRTVGLIEQLAAPWDHEQMILVITGTTEEGVALAGTALLSRTGELGGDVVFVQESGEIHALDTRSLPSTPGDGIRGFDLEGTLLIQLSERWW